MPKEAAANFSSLRMTTGTTGALSAADVTVRWSATQACRYVLGQSIFEGDVCNRGSKPVPPGVGATVYTGSPGPAQKSCVATTSTTIEPGACVPVSCQRTGQVVGVLTLRGNDTATNVGSIVECNAANNTDVVTIPPGGCPAAAQ